jgi:putative oxidoreductase
MKLGIGLTVARVTLGSLMIGHGTQKLFGWLGGLGPTRQGEAFEQIGLIPGKPNAIAAGAAELAGGTLLALGLVTPAASAAITGSSATAVRTVHASSGPWIYNGGWEYTATIVAVLFALVDAGPGKLSLDHVLLGRERWGEGWALAALGVGIAGSAVVVELGHAQVKRRQEEEADAPLNPVTSPDGTPQAHHTTS